MPERLTCRGLLATLASGLVATAAMAAPAAVQVSVGDARLHGGALVPYTNEWQVSVHDRTGKSLPVTATWSDELRATTVGSRDSMQRTQVAVFRKEGKEVGRTETVNVFARDTMAPLSRRFHKHAAAPGQEEDTTVEFAGRAVHWRRTASGTTDERRVELATPVFDFYGGLYGLLLAALPLARGFTVELPSLDESTPAVTSVTMTVQGEEEVAAGHLGKVRAWVVAGDTALGPMTFWITRAAPYIVRLEYTAKDSGLVWSYRET